MTPGEIAFLLIYFTVLVGLSFYGGHRYQMAYLYYRHKRRPPPLPSQEGWGLPRVTIQLPVFNERYVVRRLVDYVCRIRYPQELLEIQVLDDSTDDTVELARAAVEEWHARGVNIVHIHRTDRTGFKAGALQAGMEKAHGEFIAVFDADFTPTEDFLERVVPYFADPKTGMVQARWDHINRNYSILTQAQSILLDGHFMIEHTARNRSGRFFNFNGTAGMWRRAAIIDAGGWQHDTLTEDLDLSYRAQIKGWHFVYLNDLLSPAEVPVEMRAFKSQQHRWAKGSVQVALKVLPLVWKSNLPWKVKFEAFVHLTSNFAYVGMIILSLLMPFSLHIRVMNGWYQVLLLDLPFFLGATVSVCAFYLMSQVETKTWKQWWRPIVYLPVVLALGIGLAVNNAKATIEAVLGHDSPFVRTPKLAVEATDGQRPVVASKRYRQGHNWLPLFEILLGLYYTGTVIYCLTHSVWMALPFMMLFQFGFLYTGFTSAFQWTFKRPASDVPEAEEPAA